MFSRSKPKPFKQKLRDAIYPRMGMRRLLRFWLLKTARLNGSASYIARGIACGAAISCTPFVGLHFIISGIVAWLISGNIIASAIGTAFGNPLTFPTIWLVTYHTGTLLIGGDDSVNYAQALADPLHFVNNFSDYFLPIFIPMLVGCIPWVIMVWIIFYYATYKPLEKLKNKVRQQ